MPLLLIDQRVHPLHIALRRISREEHAHDWIVVARIEVVQPGAVVVLPDEALGRVETACVVAIVAIRPEQLVALHGGPTRGIGERGDQAALGVAEVELRAVAIQRAKQGK